LAIGQHRFPPTITSQLQDITLCRGSYEAIDITPLLQEPPILKIATPVPPVNPGKPRITLINAAAYTCVCKLKGTTHFQLRVSLPEVTGHSTTTSDLLVNLNHVPEEYHTFADVFSKIKAGKLAEHRPYNLKITLDEGTTPFGPIYSLSQEELARFA